MVEWFLLGIYLDIPESDLEKIKYENQWNVSDCKREMLSTWLRRNPQPTWATIVNTLTDIGRMSLAYKIALKYGKQMVSMLKQPSQWTILCTTII